MAWGDAISIKITTRLCILVTLRQLCLQKGGPFSCTKGKLNSWKAFSIKDLSDRVFQYYTSQQMCLIERLSILSTK